MPRVQAFLKGRKLDSADSTGAVARVLIQTSLMRLLESPDAVATWQTFLEDCERMDRKARDAHDRLPDPR